MNTNNNDYVIVNGRKYFATGGNYGIDPKNFSGGDIVEYTERNTNNSDPSNDYGHSYYLKLDDDDLDENGNGYHLNENGTNSRKAMFVQGRNNISKFLRENYDENLLKNKYGIDLKQWDDDTNNYGPKLQLDKGDEGFNNRNSRRVYYALSDLFDNDMFQKQTKDIKKWQYQDKEKGEKQAYNEIPLGRNITKSVATFSPILGSYLTPDEKEAIRKNPELQKELFYTDSDGNEHMRDFSTFEDGNGNLIISASKMSNPYDKNGKKVQQRLGNSVFALNSKLEPTRLKGENATYRDDKGFVKMNKYTDKNGDYLSNFNVSNDETGNYVLKNWMNRNGDAFYYDNLIGNRKRFGSDDKNQLFQHYTGIHAYGGHTTRLYAVGGTTGEQIPIGEQPDYNMVGAGGSHEMNPQGGVPYGMNQDGSQNMVEQGEVSVGNNVFSDRTAISPELCQQLGLPEGTSPAQAMQQIEALYEQGQIGDQEFQEIQQIIFDDQEAQKQNVGGSYQQGQVGGEGITPDMMQGQNMPPQAMLQQSAPEGIAPEMVQGGAYAFGGRRRC